MEKIKIYVHGENTREQMFLEIPPDATVEEIIRLYHEQFPNAGNVEEIALFMEDIDDIKERKHPHHDAGIHHRGHIHCHRCKEIEVTVVYNGDDKFLHFAPSTLAKRVLKKALEEFHINEHDAGDYELKIDERTILAPTDHIGSFTSFPKCHVKLFLTAKRPVQG